MPQRHVLQRNNRVSANDARQATQALVCNRIAFVRHRGAAFLAFAEKFFHFENFSALEVPKLGRPTIDTGRDHSERSHKFRMPIALHDLG